METEFIERLFSKGFLANKKLLESNMDFGLLEKVEMQSDLIVLNDDYVGVISLEPETIDWYELDKCRVEFEKERDDEPYQNQLQNINGAGVSFQVKEVGVIKEGDNNLSEVSLQKRK